MSEAPRTSSNVRSTQSSHHIGNPTIRVGAAPVGGLAHPASAAPASPPAASHFARSRLQIGSRAAVLLVRFAAGIQHCDWVRWRTDRSTELRQPVLPHPDESGAGPAARPLDDAYSKARSSMRHRSSVNRRMLLVAGVLAVTGIAADATRHADFRSAVPFMGISFAYFHREPCSSAGCSNQILFKLP